MHNGLLDLCGGKAIFLERPTASRRKREGIPPVAKERQSVRVVKRRKGTIRV